MKAIIITGTPGTGKTQLAKALARLLHAKHLPLRNLLKKHSIGFDRDRKCFIVDEKKITLLVRPIIRQSKQRLIIDSHLSHYIDPSLVEVCIVTRCELKELAKRLKRRKYSKQKIMDNTEAEIFEMCLEEAKELGHKTIVVDTSSKSPQMLAKSLTEAL